MKNSISKKALSAFLAIMMIFATMAGMFTFSASADAISGNWTDYYDLSWITPYDGTPASTANYVQVGDKYYQVLGYAAGTEFTIENAADLAGLAKLTNVSTTAKRTNPYFSNCTFYITAETIDLSAHYWMPIASNANNQNANACQLFGGHLIGANSKDTNGIVTINGMTVNETRSTATGTGNDRYYASGLIGMQGGGSVQNFALTNATITSNSGYGVGSFVGRQWGPSTNSSGAALNGDNVWNNANHAERCTTTYSNLSSDAVITKTSNSTDAHNTVAGIVGSAASGYYITLATFTNCTFTGSITAATSNVGGIIGYGETGGSNGKGVYVEFDNCDVSATMYTAKGNIGGLAGSTKAMVIAENCDVSATISSATANSVPTGGMVGAEVGACTAHTSDELAAGKAYMSFTKCTFTGSVTAKEKVGLFVGAENATTKVFLTSCKVGGDVANNAVNWFGSGVSLTETAFANNSSSFLTKYYDGATSVPAINDANETTIKDLGIQMSNDGTKMRVSAQILGKEYDKAGFEFYVTYTIDDVVKSSKINAKDVSTCYTSIKAGDETIYADSGYYYIVFVIDGFDSATMSDISIGFAASVTKDATVTWSDSAYCDATVEVTQPG